MLRKLKKWYGDLWYWGFRLVYTTGHWLTFLLLPSSKTSGEGRDVVLVCGAEYENRYSAAKLDLFAHRCQKAFPGTTLVLLSKLEDGVARGQGRPYTTVPWEYQTRARLSSRFLGRFYRASTFDPEVIRDYARRARFMVDLGDHQLDARKTTGWTANAMANIVFAKAFGLPFFWYPQSVGPLFGFWGWPLLLKSVLHRMTRTLPTWAEAFCIREEAGLQAFQKISRAPARRCLDYLIYAAEPVGTLGWSAAPTTLAVVPGPAANDAESLARLLEGLRSRNRGRFLRFVCYRWDETSLAQDQEEPVRSLGWELLDSGPLSKPETFLSSSPEVLVVSADWGCQLTALLAGRPAVAVSFDEATRQLYRDFRIEFLMADPSAEDGADQLSAAIDRVFAQYESISRNAVQRRRELIEAYPLPTPV